MDARAAALDRAMSAAAPSHAAASIETAGGVLNAVHAGAGPALLLLHGWTLDHRMWRPQMAALAARFHVIALDRRGFGRSTAPPCVAREASDVVRVLDHFGIERAVILGMSQAGRVALDAALRFPPRVRALVLQGAPFPGSLEANEGGREIALADLAEFAVAGAYGALRETLLAHPFLRVRDPAGAALVRDILADYRGRDLIGPRMDPAIDARDLIAIRAPALVITGADDTRMRRKASDLLARAIPGARRADIANAGHLCNLCQPSAFNAVLTDFLDALPA